MNFNLLKVIVGFTVSSFFSSTLLAQQNETTIHLVWSKQPTKGLVRVTNGHLNKVRLYRGEGKIKDAGFLFTKSGASGITLELDKVNDDFGPGATLVHILSEKDPFSFLLRDVKENFPIYLPKLGVAVLTGNDSRSFAEVEQDILSRKTLTKLQAIELKEETSFSSVEAQVRSKTAPTWLGLSRDFRIFEVNQDEALAGIYTVYPKNSVSPVNLPETNGGPSSYYYTLGRGLSHINRLKRHLEQGSMPILHSVLTDDDITYHSISFVTLEKSALTQAANKGTHFLVADNSSAGHMFTKSQEEEVNKQVEIASKRTEETVYFQRTEIINTGKVPRYAWFMNPKSNHAYTFDSNTGYSAYSQDRIFCVSKLNGKPFANQEMAILLQPGEKALFEFYIPHTPISRDRVADLEMQSFDQRFAENKAFWSKKLQQSAQIKLPEKRIEQMLQAGLLHLDLITYGNEPNGTLAPTIGVYSSIGTESAPIIQFYASMGLNDIAKRSINYFLDKQHESGFMQNFNGYMVETGAVLWTIGEYYRYTGDKTWLKDILPKLLKSSDFLIDWRNKNKIESLKGAGYGMISGKVADPEDDFHQFMLNGYAYVGLSRMGEILADIDPANSKRILKEAADWKADIRKSFFESLAKSPVIPIGDGTWSQTAPPWAEGKGPRALYLDKENFFSHATFMVPDGLLGPLYLVFCEVLDVNEPATSSLLNYHSELLLQGNVMFSQPYYSRHNWLQAKRGMVKPFLDTYYNTFAGLVDRETYTFWEHFHGQSPHKTHEEAWFLMETRWMLYLEDGDTLNLLKTIPRAWMEDGKEIQLSDVQSYFGKINLETSSHVTDGYIEATIVCDSDRKPGTVAIRLPHPKNNRPIKVTGGVYDEKTETVIISSFTGKANVRLEY